MTAVVRAPTTGGGGSGSNPPAVNARGSVIGLAPQASATLCTHAATGWKLRGFAVFGDNDVVAWVEVDGVELSGITARGSVVKVADLVIPNPEATVGTTVALRVKNDAPLIGGVSASFEGTLFGE